MFSHSRKTARVTDIPLDAEDEFLPELIQNITVVQDGHGNWKFRSHWRRLPVGDFSNPVISLAPQLRHKTATITFSSEGQKKQALEYGVRNSLSIDDTFNGTTVLYSAANPYLE
jgi:hypothetical protein